VRAAALAAGVAATGCATDPTTGGPHEAPALVSSDAAANGIDAGSGADEPTLDAARAIEASIPTASDADAGFALYDDFESAAVGGPPNPSLWTVVSPDCSGTGTLAIDDSEAHSGHHSVRVDGGGGYCDHVFFSNASAITGLGDGGGQVYARFFVRLGAALGQGHVTFVAMEDQNDGDDDVRMGGQDAILMYNRQSDDATLPTLSPTGVGDSVVIPAATWTCIEFHIDPSAGTIDTWVNGAEVPGLVEDGTAVADISTQWLAKTWRPSLATFQVGWESYAGETMTLWFDDVALASFRVGCGPSTAAPLPLAGTLDGG
jgi:hypothetical protein